MEKELRVFNQEKTQELYSYDLERGYLKNDSIFVKHHEEVKEVLPKYQIEQYRDEDNSVKTRRIVIVEGVTPRKAYDEYEDIKVYIPYTQAELQKRYEDKVEELIREKYTLSQELAILRQRDTKPEEFAAYSLYAENCKSIAKQQLQVNTATVEHDLI